MFPLVNTSLLREKYREKNQEHCVQFIWLSKRFGFFCDILWKILNEFLFFGHSVARGNLLPEPGIKSMPPAVEAQSLNHWTAREVPHPPMLFHLV